MNRFGVQKPGTPPRVGSDPWTSQWAMKRNLWNHHRAMNRTLDPPPQGFQNIYTNEGQQNKHLDTKRKCWPLGPIQSCSRLERVGRYGHGVEKRRPRRPHRLGYRSTARIEWCCQWFPALEKDQELDIVDRIPVRPREIAQRGDHRVLCKSS
jgi:hypothetical protein